MQGQKIELPMDQTIDAAICQKFPSQKNKALSAVVNNQLVHLSYPLKDGDLVQLVDYSSSLGREIYRKTLALIFFRAIFEMQRNTRLVLNRSIGNAWYYDFFSDTPISDGFLNKVSERMRGIIEANETIELATKTRKSAISFFTQKAYADKARLIRYLKQGKVTVYSCGKVHDISVVPLAPRTGLVPNFQLKAYEHSILLTFPAPDNFNKMSVVPHRPLLFHTHEEGKSWGKIMRVGNLGRLNERLAEEGSQKLIQIAEALHEKKIAEIADLIKARKGAIKIIFIAGPSASGKTTFSKRLKIHLMVNGIFPQVISLDDFYKDREKTPKKKDGSYDFESIEALDIKHFKQVLTDLLAGRETWLPKFNFKEGKSIPQGKPLELFEDELLIIEGIHGLNEILTAAIPEKYFFRIYVSSLTQISIDDHNRISTRSSRLIRRLVRDSQYRGYNAQTTLRMWPQVMAGEERWIYPHQEKADAMFNSALVYELAVLKRHALPLLLSVDRTAPEWLAAQPLVGILQYFLPIKDEKLIPHTSILREFIGGLHISS
jgi:uridine kinase